MSRESASGYWWVGPATGALVSTLITVVVVIWEWVENPGGIFRNELGTNWQFVVDTAVSWLVPTFIYLTAIISVSQLVWHLLRKYRTED